MLITGGSSGIGWALAQKLLSHGCKVIILDVKDPPESNALFFKVNVSDREAIFQLQQDLKDPPTIIVNNAGIARPGPFLNIEPEAVFAVNCLAHFWILQAFLPAMQKKSQGHIISVSSCLGLGAVPFLADYCASKAALIALSESLRLEFPWLTITTLCPFLVQTEMFRDTRLRFPWLLPPLTVEQVVDEMVYAMETRFNGDIWLPRRLWPLPILRLFPWSLYGIVMRLSGGCDALKC